MKNLRTNNIVLRKSLASTALLTFAFAAVGCSPSSPKDGKSTYGVIKADKDPYKATINSIVSVDAYGRSFGEGDVSSSDRLVGMFYFIWHGEHVNDGIYDVTKFQSTEEGRRELWDLNSNVSKAYQFHYFDEPLYGYYCSDDPWVLTKHIELLTMSGIDYISLDLTNISIYEKNTTAVLEKLLEFQNNGWNVPKVTSFLTGTDRSLNHPQRILNFYNAFYKNPKYDSLWFRDEKTGKPIIEIDRSAYYSGLDQAVINNLYIRNTIWPFDKGPSQYEDASWMDWEYPQRVYENQNGNYMSVSVTQHVGGSFGVSVNPNMKDLPNLRTKYAEKYNQFDTGGATNYDSNRGRGWDYELNKNVAENAFKGTNFETQWRNALNNEKQIDEVFVTGWNEWIAYKYPMEIFGVEDIYGDYFNEVSFCDTCDDEFSRDIEMTKDGYGDNFYLQNMRLTRQFKSKDEVRYAGEYATQNLNNLNWDNARTYLDFKGDAIERDFDRADHNEIYKYHNTTNRNDIIETKMSNDGNNLYIQIKTSEDIIIDKEKSNNLNVLLSIEGSEKPSWEGYQFILNRDGLKNGEGLTSLESFKSDGEYDLKKIDDCPFVLNHDTLSISIPLSSIGLKDGDFTIDFKVADGNGDPSDIMNYYVDGDSAPIGRLNYRYNSNHI